MLTYSFVQSRKRTTLPPCRSLHCIFCLSFAYSHWIGLWSDLRSHGLHSFWRKLEELGVNKKETSDCFLHSLFFQQGLKTIAAFCFCVWSSGLCKLLGHREDWGPEEEQGCLWVVPGCSAVVSQIPCAWEWYLWHLHVVVISFLCKEQTWSAWEVYPGD